MRKRYKEENGQKMNRPKANGFVDIIHILMPFAYYFAGYFLVNIITAAYVQAKGEIPWEDGYTPLIGGLAMIGGFLFLMPLVTARCKGLPKQTNGTNKESLPKQILQVLLYCLYVAASVLAVNGALYSLNIRELTDSYADVAASQYAVPFWGGIILYVCIAPVVEETLFRYLVLNKVIEISGRVWPSILCSALLFGFYHGNLLQGIYACIIGILFAMAYQCTGSFLVPVLMHAVGNLTVYLGTVEKSLNHVVTSTPVLILCDVIFLAGTVFIVTKLQKKIKDSTDR